MKKILCFIGLLFLVSCASSTPKVRVKNCKALGNGLYECEELTKHNFGEGRP